MFALRSICVAHVVWCYPSRIFLLWSIPQGYNIEKEQKSDDMISCAKVVSVSILCSRCSNFIFFSCFMTHFPYELHINSLWLIYIYSVDTILYPYTLPLESIPILTSSLCLSTTWALWVKVVILLHPSIYLITCNCYCDHVIQCNWLCNSMILSL